MYVRTRHGATHHEELPRVTDLIGRELLAAEPDGRRFLYTPLIAREDYIGGESRRLVDRLFGGRAVSLVAHLAESEALTDDDLAEIEALLKELRP